MLGTLHYICISRGKTILAEYTEDVGNFRNYMPDILSRVTPDKKEQYNSADVRFFIESTDKFTFCVLCSKDYIQRVGFEAISQIKQLFYDKFTEDQRDKATEHALDKFIKNDLKE